LQPRRILFGTGFQDEYFATFIEPEIKLSSWFAARIGGRFEYSGLNKESSFQPRISLATKLSTFSQLSFAYGAFNQSVQNDFRKFNNELKAEKAEHYILNFQYVKKARTFRVEAYYKNYSHLIKYVELNYPDKESYSNGGTGYAKGIDVFWRDRNTFKNIDYYISYSFVDTEREYRDYPSMASPNYTSKHNFSFVYKQWLNKINSQVGLTYSYTSGRPYNNPNEPAFMAGRTPEMHDLSMNYSYLFQLFNKSAIIHFSASNVLGFNKIYSYRFPHLPNENMNYPAYEVKPPAKRFFVMVFLLSL
jgi:outer membrane cobalamin receptor